MCAYAQKHLSERYELGATIEPTDFVGGLVKRERRIFFAFLRVSALLRRDLERRQ